MEDYAVVRIKGNQYKVSQGEEILLSGDYSEELETEVLLFLKDGKLSVGKPTLKGKTVKLKVVDEKVKGKKIEVLKYKAKSRYRKKIGFRPVATKLLVEKLG